MQELEIVFFLFLSSEKRLSLNKRSCVIKTTRSKCTFAIVNDSFWWKQLYFNFSFNKAAYCRPIVSQVGFETFINTATESGSQSVDKASMLAYWWTPVTRWNEAKTHPDEWTTIVEMGWPR